VGRHDERERAPHEEHGHQHVPELERIGQQEHEDGELVEDEHRLARHDQPPLLHPVCDHPTERRYHQHRDSNHQVDEAEGELALRQVVGQVRTNHELAVHREKEGDVARI